MAAAIEQLGLTIGHIQFLKTALVTRFPDFKLGTQHFPRERLVIDLGNGGAAASITQQRP